MLEEGFWERVSNTLVLNVFEEGRRIVHEKVKNNSVDYIFAFFDEVEAIDLYSVNWNMQYNRNNQTYRMLISICYLVVKGLLQTQADGTTKLMDFLDEQRMHLFWINGIKFLVGNTELTVQRRVQITDGLTAVRL